MRDKIDSRWMGIKSGEEQAYALVLLDADVDTGEFMQVDYMCEFYITFDVNAKSTF